MSGITGANNDFAVRYEQLKHIANGEVNKGEIVLGKSGQFEKINNHVFLNINFRHTSAAQNRATREAIYNLVEQHVKQKYGINANIVLAQLKPYLLGDNVEEKVSRNMIKGVLDKVDDEKRVALGNSNSKYRTRCYNELAKTLSANIPSVDANKVLNACYVRLLRFGEATRGLSDKTWGALKTKVDDLIAACRQDHFSTYERLIQEICEGITLPRNVDNQNQKQRTDFQNGVLINFGESGRVDDKYKLSDEESELVSKLLTGNDNKLKPLLYENRRQLVDLMKGIPSGPERLDALSQWPSTEKTEKLIETALDKIARRESREGQMAVNEQPPQQPAVEAQPQQQPAVEGQVDSNEVYVRIQPNDDELNTSNEGVDLKPEVQQQVVNEKIEEEISTKTEQEPGVGDQPQVVNEEVEEEISTKAEQHTAEVNGTGTAQNLRQKGPVTKQMEAELAKNLEGVTGKDERRRIISDHFETCLANKAYVAEQKQVDYKLERGNAFFESRTDLKDELEGRVSSHGVKKNPFMGLEGYSTNVLSQLYKMAKEHPDQFPNFKPAVLLFGDDTSCGCGVVKGWRTQEESIMRDIGPGLMAHFIGNGLVEEENEEKLFHYKGNDGNELNTAREGWTASVPLQYVDMMEQEGAEGMEMLLFGRSTSSLSDYDVNGNVRHLQCCREMIYGEQPLTPEGVDLARKFQKELYSQLDDLGFGQKTKERALAEKLFMYTTECDVLSKNPKAEVKRFLDYIVSTNQADVARRKGLEATANANFDKVFRSIVRRDIIEAREKGVTHFIGGAIGCGAFYHDPKVIARIYAEEFIKHGGDMVYVMPDMGSKTAGIFKAAFEEAMLELGPKKPIMTGQMNLLKDLAHFAYGSGRNEGAKGGAGYMGIINGRAAKFLTHPTERWGTIGSGFSAEEKARTNKATRELEVHLLAIAKDISERLETRIKKMIEDARAQKKQKLAEGVNQMFERTDVAAILSEIAKYAVDENGGVLSWDDPSITAPNPIASTRIQDVLADRYATTF